VTYSFFTTNWIALNFKIKTKQIKSNQIKSN